jgi:hypothetical protein
MADLPTNIEEVKEIIKEVVKPDGFPGEWELSDGSKIKATSYEEAFNKAVDMKVNTAAALRDRERQIEELQAKISQQPPVQPTPPASTTAFDQKHYWELMNQDPLQAQQYMDAARFGVQPDQVQSLYQEVFNTTQYSADKKEIEDFMQSNKDFPATKEATDKIWAIMGQENFPITSRNLEYVYLRAVRDGEIEPLQEESPQPWVPPNMQGGGTERQRQNPFDPFEGVPDDKLDEVARRIGMMK